MYFRLSKRLWQPSGRGEGRGLCGAGMGGGSAGCCSDGCAVLWSRGFGGGDVVLSGEWGVADVMDGG